MPAPPTTLHPKNGSHLIARGCNPGTSYVPKPPAGRWCTNWLHLLVHRISTSLWHLLSSRALILALTFLPPWESARIKGSRFSAIEGQEIEETGGGAKTGKAVLKLLKYIGPTRKYTYLSTSQLQDITVSGKLRLHNCFNELSFSLKEF